MDASLASKPRLGGDGDEDGAGWLMKCRMSLRESTQRFDCGPLCGREIWSK